MMKPMRADTFRWLDAVFWGIWLLAPFLIWQAFEALWSHPYSYEQYGNISAQNVSSYSTLGKVLVAFAAGVDMLLAATILLLMHRLVRQFKRGELLIVTTLNTMKNMAWVCICMPLIEILLYNLNTYLLYVTGDMPAWQPLYTLKLMLVALGFFLYALYMLIQHAIALQKDVDLTV